KRGVLLLQPLIVGEHGLQLVGLRIPLAHTPTSAPSSPTLHQALKELFNANSSTPLNTVPISPSSWHSSATVRKRPCQSRGGSTSAGGNSWARLRLNVRCAASAARVGLSPLDPIKRARSTTSFTRLLAGLLGSV